MSFDPTHYGPTVAALLAEPRLPQLGPGHPDPKAGAVLRSLTAETLFDRPPRDRAAASACLAGLWLWFDHLDESHTISQEISTAEGSYWHAVLHRREPDPSNAAYWFRRVGDHPIFVTLAKEAQDLGLRLGSHRWIPFDFIDWCEKHRGTGTEQEARLRQVQRREWELLFDWCFRRATGGE
jgi:hypothetical protein